MGQTTTTWNPQVVEESNAGVREISVRAKMLSRGYVFLDGAITGESAQAVVLQLLYLQSEGRNATLVIDSGGGSVQAGLMIIDAMKGFGEELTVICAGTAMSMAAVILAAGPKGRRFILPHGTVMIHEPLIGENTGGSASSIRNLSENMETVRKRINKLLADATGQTVKKIDKDTAAETYMTAGEAAAYGMCDRVITSFAETESGT